MILQPDDHFRRDFGEKHKILPKHFQPLQLLGSGSFGEVYLVRKKTSGALFAMKV